MGSIGYLSFNFTLLSCHHKIPHCKSENHNIESVYDRASVLISFAFWHLRLPVITFSGVSFICRRVNLFLTKTFA